MWIGYNFKEKYSDVSFPFTGVLLRVTSEFIRHSRNSEKKKSLKYRAKIVSFDITEAVKSWKTFLRTWLKQTCVYSMCVCIGKINLCIVFMTN